MTELHWALLGLAVVLLAAVAVFNRWQQRRDVALSGLDAAKPPLSTGDGAPGAGRIEPRLDEAGVPPSGPVWIEDPLVDVVLEIRCAHAIDGVTAIDAARRLRALQLTLGATLVAWDARRAQWVEPDRFGFYNELAAGAQLAHRRHALDELEASRFLACIQQLAAELDADVDAPEAGRLVEMARDLDELLRRFDVRIGITVAADRPFDPVALSTAMTAGGLVASGTHWRRLDSQGATVFTATDAGGPGGRIGLEIDVPLAPVAEHPLSSMIVVAEALADRLGGRLVDDAGRSVTAASLAAIERPLADLVSQMRAADIEPGSLRARRLFA